MISRALVLIIFLLNLLPPFPLDAVEIGTNDFRVSDMGPDGNISFDAQIPAVAYNSQNDQFLIVWIGDDNSGSLIDGENEVWGRLVNSNGTFVGARFRISDMGNTDGSTTFLALSVAVTYNVDDNQYLVVWTGDDETGTLVNNEFELFGQRLDASGNEIGTNDFRISNMGPDGNTSFGTTNLPDVIYNPRANQYLACWRGDDNTGALVDGEFEVFCQRLDSSGAEVGTDFRISDMGADGNTTDIVETTPKIAYNIATNQYLVVWSGRDDVTGADEREVYGQLLDANGNEIGTNDFRISDVGVTGSTAWQTRDVDVAYNSRENQYLVVFDAEDDALGLPNGEYEVLGQLLDADGNEIRANDFRISDMGGDGSVLLSPFTPRVDYNVLNNEYFVIWRGDDTEGALVDGENEIFGQALDATGAELGGNDVRLSDMGPDSSTLFLAQLPTIAYREGTSEFLITWMSDDDVSPVVNGENEIWGQFFESDAPGFTSLSPASGTKDGRTSVTLSGKNFTAATQVTLGGLPVTSLAFVDSQTLTFMTPTGPVGSANLSIMNIDDRHVTANNAFSYTEPPTGTLRSYPNPFRPSQGHTTITFDSVPSGTKIKIFSLQGQLVREITVIGTDGTTWDVKNDSGTNVASGVYYVQIGSSISQKLVIQR